MSKFITVVRGSGHEGHMAAVDREAVKQITEAAGHRRAPAGHGAGVSVLCAGCGAAAEQKALAIAAGVNRPLYRVDLGAVASQYVGETEKNLNAVFAEAQAADAVLMFDEADALLGKRSEVKDSHDRYANLETADLLQRIEQYDGIAVLATNSSGNVDEKVRRRMRFVLQ
jgi:SpoVK/Ycf46/Vps4 family AAA+-type ATPase